MILLYTATIFVSAALLFSVQPMVGKMILPLLGGTPAVWNLCMVFFQAALLAGYAYAHGAVAHFGVRRQALVHLIILATPLPLLPIIVAADPPPPADGTPVLWLLGRLTLAVGLPFLVVSTSAPLLQRWFSATGHAASNDPYFLYAASNAGSLLALLGYPLVIEPLLDLETQTRVWSYGYHLLIVMAVACVAMLWRSSNRAGCATDDSAIDAHPDAAPTSGHRLRWIALAFVPSSLMLGVTAHITTDIAAAPLFWVVPLALYLLTFVLVFARKPFIPTGWMSAATPYMFLPIALLIYSTLRISSWLIVPIHLGAFFLAAMVCHQELARTRPAARHLTEFYLLMSIGGVLGGVFNALVAPVVFTAVVEYPLVMVLACFFRTTSVNARTTERARRMDYLLPVALIVVIVVIVLVRNAVGLAQSQFGLLLVFCVPAMVCFGFKERPVRFALGYAVLLVAVANFAHPVSGERLEVSRNFFGVKKVVLDEDGRFRRLYHGSTTHGIQGTDPATNRTPLSYYYPTGPIGDVFAMTEGQSIRARVGIIGLGTGAIASYAEPGDHITYYEIDPGVERIARDPRYFTFMDQCKGSYDVVLGDGRLTLGRAPDASFGIIILDAFSSDAVPTHLLSAEALDIYMSKLRDDGVLVYHISNRHLNFEPMVAQLAHTAGLACLARADVKVPAREVALGKRGSHWIAMARRMVLLQPLADDFRWSKPDIPPGTPVWTDRYCDIISLFSEGSLSVED